MNHNRYTGAAPKAYGGEGFDSVDAQPEKLMAEFKEKNHAEGMAIWK